MIEAGSAKADGLENLTNILSFKKRKKFHNYLSDEEYISNLDSLLEAESDVGGVAAGG